MILRKQLALTLMINEVRESARGNGVVVDICAELITDVFD